PRALRRNGRGNKPELHAAPRGGERELRPDVELAEDERRRLQGIERRGDLAGTIDWEIVRHIHRQVLGQSLGGRRKKSERELPVGMLGSQCLEYRLRLQAFTPRWRMHPAERAARIPSRRRAGSKTGG